MNLMEYEKQKIKQWSAYELSYRLFELTGKTNYCRLALNIREHEKEQKWTNTESKEL